MAFLFVIGLLLLLSSGAARPTWTSIFQPYRDNSAARAIDGPSSSDSLSVLWTLPIRSPDLAGVLTNIVSESVDEWTTLVYTLTDYRRQNYSAFSAINATTGQLLWSSNVVHTGYLYAAMGVQLAGGVLISHAVDPFAPGPFPFHIVDGISTLDGSQMWTWRATQLYDHVSTTPDANQLILADYFEGVVTLLNGANGVLISNFSALCVSPVVTPVATVCFCDGMGRFATHLCGYSRTGALMYKMRGHYFFPSSTALAYSPFGNGAVLVAAATITNSTTLYAINPADGTPTLWPEGMAPGALNWRADATDWRITDISTFADDGSALLVGAPVPTPTPRAAGSSTITVGTTSSSSVVGRSSSLCTPEAVVAAEAAAGRVVPLWVAIAAPRCHHVLTGSVPFDAPHAHADFTAAGTDYTTKQSLEYTTVGSFVDTGSIAFFSLRTGLITSTPLSRSRTVFGISNVVVGWDLAANNRSASDSRPPQAAMYVHSSPSDGAQSLSTMSVGQDGRVSAGAGVSVGDNQRYLTVAGPGLLVSAGLMYTSGLQMLGTQVTAIGVSKGGGGGPPSHSAAAIAGVVTGIVVGLVVVGALGYSFYKRSQKSNTNYVLAGGLLDGELAGDVAGNLDGVGDVYAAMGDAGQGPADGGVGALA